MPPVVDIRRHLVAQLLEKGQKEAQQTPFAVAVPRLPQRLVTILEGLRGSKGSLLVVHRDQIFLQPEPPLPKVRRDHFVLLAGKILVQPLVESLDAAPEGRVQARGRLPSPPVARPAVDLDLEIGEHAPRSALLLDPRSQTLVERPVHLGLEVAERGEVVVVVPPFEDAGDLMSAAMVVDESVGEPEAVSGFVPPELVQGLDRPIGVGLVRFVRLGRRGRRVRERGHVDLRQPGYPGENDDQDSGATQSRASRGLHGTWMTPPRPYGMSDRERSSIPSFRMTVMASRTKA